MVMPIMGDSELVARLRAEHKSLRVVFMLGYTEHSSLRHGLLETGVLMLQKPFTRDALLLKIREALQTAWYFNGLQHLLTEGLKRILLQSEQLFAIMKCVVSLVE
jgi:CheY-like chemotaxis protein